MPLSSLCIIYINVNSTRFKASSRCLTTYKINHTSKKIDWVIFQSLKLKSHLRFWLKFLSCASLLNQHNYAHMLIPKITFLNHNSHTIIFIINKFFQPCHASLFQSIKEIGYATYLHMHKLLYLKHTIKQNKTKTPKSYTTYSTHAKLNNFPHT